MSAEHYIGYAYPSSTVACALGREKLGCWYLKVHGKSTPHSSFDEAAEAAKKLGTQPDRWSADHPANAQFRAVS